MLQEFTATWHNIQMDSLLLSNQNHFQNRQIIFKDFRGLGYAAFKLKWSQGPKVPWIFARPTEEISISCCTAHSSTASECGQCHVVSIRSSRTQTQCSYQQLSAACWTSLSLSGSHYHCRYTDKTPRLRSEQVRWQCARLLRTESCWLVGVELNAPLDTV